MADFGKKFSEVMDNPLWQFGVGMLSAPQGVNFGQALGAGSAQMQNYLQQQLLNKFREEEQARQQRLLQMKQQSIEQAGSQFEKTYGLREQELEQKRQESEANQRLGQQKLGLDAQKLAFDRASTGIKLGLESEANDIRQQQAQIAQNKATEVQAEKNLQRQEKMQKQLSDLKTTRAFMDNSIDTIQQLLANPELKNVVGPVEGSDLYPTTLASIYNPLADSGKRADALRLIETIKSQQFLDNLTAVKQKGATFGSLTEKEGEKVAAYITNLDRRSSESQYVDNLNKALKILLMGRNNLQTRYGNLLTGEEPELGVQPTGIAPSAPTDLESALQQYGGSTMVPGL